MNINITFKNFEPSEHLKQYAHRRFEKILKYLGKSDNTELQVTLNVEKFRHMAEIKFVGDYAHLSAYEESDDMYSTIDLVLDKIEAQVKKLREKSKSRRRSFKEKSVSMQFITYDATESGERFRSVVDTDHYEPKPMDVDEAAMQLDNLKYEFLVFRNSETDRVNVIYRRKNNDYGLIDPGT